MKGTGAALKTFWRSSPMCCFPTQCVRNVMTNILLQRNQVTRNRKALVLLTLYFYRWLQATHSDIFAITDGDVQALQKTHLGINTSIGPAA